MAISGFFIPPMGVFLCDISQRVSIFCVLLKTLNKYSNDDCETETFSIFFCMKKYSKYFCRTIIGAENELFASTSSAIHVKL